MEFDWIVRTDSSDLEWRRYEGSVRRASQKSSRVRAVSPGVTGQHSFISSEWVRKCHRDVDSGCCRHLTAVLDDVP